MKITFENFINNNIPPELAVIYPGRFQPAHKNHAKVYKFLKEQFPYASVFISTSNKIKLPKSPFSFEEKKIMLMAAGVPELSIIQTTSPYQALEITSKLNSKTCRVIFAVGGKDMDPLEPRFNFLPTKTGDAYFKPLEKIKNISQENVKELYPLGTHGYVATIPTFRFNLKLAGQVLPIQGASEIRDLYQRASEAGRKEIIQQLYGTFNETIYDLFNKRLT